MRSDAKIWIEQLGLLPHPEGGYFNENYRAAESIEGASLPERYTGDRSCSTAIYYLLGSGDFSAFHRLRSDEIWHYYAGCSLHLHVVDPDGGYERVTLGRSIEAGDRPQVVVARNQWFAAEPAEQEAFALAGCTVAPGFEMADFEMADRDTLIQAHPAHAELITRLTR